MEHVHILILVFFLYIQSERIPFQLRLISHINLNISSMSVIAQAATKFTSEKQVAVLELEFEQNQHF